MTIRVKKQVEFSVKNTLYRRMFIDLYLKAMGYAPKIPNKQYERVFRIHPPDFVTWKGKIYPGRLSAGVGYVSLVGQPSPHSLKYYTDTMMDDISLKSGFLLYHKSKPFIFYNVDIDFKPGFYKKLWRIAPKMIGPFIVVTNDKLENATTLMVCTPFDKEQVEKLLKDKSLDQLLPSFDLY